MHAQSRRDWARFEPDAIPTKQQVPQLESWLDRIGLAPGARVLDVGCGAGEIARRVIARGFGCVGLDINPAAIRRATREWPAARFYQRDVAAADGFRLDEPPFDAAIIQLVLSVVGDAADRAQLLRNAHAALRSGAQLFASFSGLSDDLNDEYAQLYARDVGSTHEHGSYWSRDAAGQVLYRTHHFAHDEIVALLEHSGFEAIAVEEQIEASSRRPDHRARFYYSRCRRAF